DLTSWLFALAVAAIAGPAFVRWYARRLFPTAGRLHAAEATFLRGDIDRAVADARDVLRTQRGIHDRYGATMLIGRCAEARGDFVEAEAIFARAKNELVDVFGVYRDQMLPLAAARRAFALAALGRLDEADAELTQTTHRDALPGTRWLAVRARAVSLARRGR